VVECIGENSLEKIVIENESSTRTTVDAHFLFIFIGAQPRTDWLEGVVSRDEKGFVLTGPELMRSGSTDTARRPQKLAARPRPLFTGNRCARIFVGGRCASRQHQARGL
jgi:thioredoxin reductase (NADPH)